MRSFASKAILPVALAATIAVGGLAWADDDPTAASPPTDVTTPPPGGENHQMYQFYSGNTPGDTGSFDGKIVCLRSDRKFATAPSEECGDKNRIYALDLEDVDLTQPLLAGSEQVERQLRDNLGRDVTVQGRYYESTGMILAASVLPRD
ncbi:MAG TPA: hypothetical protein VIS07_14680 [Candidatus Binatia bacterium]